MIDEANCKPLPTPEEIVRSNKLLLETYGGQRVRIRAHFGSTKARGYAVWVVHHPRTNKVLGYFNNTIFLLESPIILRENRFMRLKQKFFQNPTRTPHAFIEGTLVSRSRQMELALYPNFIINYEFNGRGWYGKEQESGVTLDLRTHQPLTNVGFVEFSNRPFTVWAKYLASDTGVVRL